MPTPDQIAEQVKHEREAIKCGIDKILKQTAKAEAREYASSTVYGTVSIKEAQEHVAQAILDTFEYQIIRGKNGVTFKEIAHYLGMFNNPEDANILANIALKRTFDLVFSIKKKDSKKHPNSVSNVTTAVGSSVEDECQIRWYEQQDPELLKKIIKYMWRAETGTRQKMFDVQHLMTDEGVLWNSWGNIVKAKLGAWLVGVVSDVTGWFEKDKLWTGKNRSVSLIIPTEKYLAIQDQLMDQAIMFAPLSWPMLVEPNQWTNENPGGYYLNEVMRGNPLVRNGDPYLLQPDTVLNFINRLQQVPYTLNKFVYDVALELKEKGHLVGKFKPIEHAMFWDFPPKPPDIDSNEEALKDWKRQTKRAHNDKKKYERSMHVRTSITMDVAKRFVDRDKFYLPWSFDYRGRAYPIPPFLSIQDTDFGKSLFLFHDKAFMTHEAEEWLKFQVATTYGLDKKTMAERLEWADNNHELISRVATDPLRHLCDWEKVDEPWQFLAACKEFYHVMIVCDQQYTSLPIAVDATCSGLQILAGLARDAGTARLVNVLPSDKPQDAYKEVAEAMIPLLPPELSHLSQYIDRSVTKRSVMTIPYNATNDSSATYIADALWKGHKVKIDRKVAYKLSLILREALTSIAPGPLAVMDWVKLEMGKAIDRGCQTIDWVTPSGFQVKQKRNNYSTKRLDCKLLGGCQFRIIDAEIGPSKSKHQSSGSPNLIHSIDSSLLHLTFERFDAPFTVIHDSVLCRATDMQTLSVLVRETYMNIFAEQDFLTDFAQQIGAETEPPIIDTLRPESVIESTYFFC